VGGSGLLGDWDNRRGGGGGGGGWGSIEKKVKSNVKTHSLEYASNNDFFQNNTTAIIR
jgi:hypothetical protein